MTTCKLTVDVKIKYPRLLVWMNVPIVMLGFSAVVPRWMIEIHGPHAANSTVTEGL